MSQAKTPEQHITCKTCGRSDVPDWDGSGHCITCARDAVLGGTPEQRLEALSEALGEIAHEHYLGCNNTPDGYEYAYDTELVIILQSDQAKAAILATVSAELRALVPGRPEKYIRMNSDCLEGYQIAIDTMITNAKARGFNL
jgi:hypothetical protein